MMEVKKLTWLSESGKEAKLLITDGEYECIAFAHPCGVREGDILNEPLHAFMLTNLMLTREEECLIKGTKENGLAHRCVARVIDKQEALVKVGGINILLDEVLPAGVEEGDLVEFNCLRLDVW